MSFLHILAFEGLQDIDLRGLSPSPGHRGGRAAPGQDGGERAAVGGRREPRRFFLVCLAGLLCDPRKCQRPFPGVTPRNRPFVPLRRNEVLAFNSGSPHADLSSAGRENRNDPCCQNEINTHCPRKALGTAQNCPEARGWDCSQSRGTEQKARRLPWRGARVTDRWRYRQARLDQTPTEKQALQGSV